MKSYVGLTIYFLKTASHFLTFILRDFPLRFFLHFYIFWHTLGQFLPPPPLRNINYFWHEPKNKNQEKIYYLQNSMPQLCSTYRWIPCPRVESIGKVAYNKKCVFDFGVYFKKKMLNIKMTPLEYQTLPQKS